MLTDFTFKDTGIKIKIRKVSPYLAADIEASIPKPLPPEQEVDYGEPKGKVMERNFSDPAYTAALNARRIEIYQVWRKALIQRGVVVEGEEWKQDVEEYKTFIQKQTGQLPEETDDLLLYVLRVCIGTNEDLDDLIDAITRRSQPTPEAIAEAKDSFQRPV